MGGVGNRHQYLLLRELTHGGGCQRCILFAQGYLLCRSLCKDGCYNTGEQNEDDGPVQDILIQYACPVSYNDNGQGGSSVGAAQPEDKRSLRGGITESFLCDEGSDPFPY